MLIVNKYGADALRFVSFYTVIKELPRPDVDCQQVWSRHPEAQVCHIFIKMPVFMWSDLKLHIHVFMGIILMAQEKQSTT